MKFLIIILSILMLSATEAIAAKKTDIRTVGVNEFEKFIANKTIVRLDVRTQEEWKDGHIAKSININVQEDNFAENVAKKISKKKKIALYCRSGRRSKLALQTLQKMGYTYIIELKDGIIGWENAHKPITKY